MTEVVRFVVFGAAADPRFRQEASDRTPLRKLTTAQRALNAPEILSFYTEVSTQSARKSAYSGSKDYHLITCML